MLKLICSETIHIKHNPGCTGRYHFSYGDYYDPLKFQLGVLEAVNDFSVEPGSGFDTHAHQEIEIISYCVGGELSHRDSLGCKETLRRGDVGYQCVGSGLMHAELNRSSTEHLRFVQILITPERPELPPAYAYQSFSLLDRSNTWVQIVSGQSGTASILISQDVSIYVSEIDKGAQLDFALPNGRQGYLLCLEGRLRINGLELDQAGAAQANGKMELSLDALENAHVLLIELPETT